MLLKNLVVNKISIHTVNSDQRDFVFDLMKGYNESSFFEKIETKDLCNRNLYEKVSVKHLIFFQIVKKVQEIKAVLPKRHKKDLHENQKRFSLNATMLFDIRNSIVSSFRNGFIRSLEHQSATKIKTTPKT